MQPTSFNVPLQVRWADLDPNFHVRHSVYYDWGAQARMELLLHYGLTTELMQQHHFGPILFREECTFRREIHYTDQISVDISLYRLRRDYARFSFVQDFKKADGTHCARLIIDGAWMDVKQRKLTTLPAEAAHIADSIPKSPEFEWIEIPQK